MAKPDMELGNLKYSELQKLAKSAGIKANMKIEKLVTALKEYYSQEQTIDSNKTKTGNDNTQSAFASSGAEEDQQPASDESAKDDTSKKKAPRGRKRDQRKGAKGKAKKTFSSEKNEEEPTVTQQNKTPEIASSQDGKFAAQASGSRKTPQGTLSRKTPTIVKPVSANSLQNRTPGIKKTTTNTTVSAKTPSTPSNVRGKRVVAEINIPGLFSPKASKSRISCAEKSIPKNLGKKSTLSDSASKCSPRILSGDENKPTENDSTPVQSGNKRKRQNTFELDGPTLESTATPEAEQTTKRTKLCSGAKPAQSSPGIQDMLDSMSGELSSAERRKKLMSVINKKVEEKVKSSPRAGPVTQIPRFAAFLAKKKQEQKKPVTPGNKDWQKVHKKEFSKFDSIDVYLEKKRKRADEMTASVKKVRTVLHEVQEAVTKLKTKRTPSLGRRSEAQSFKPSVMSTKDMNLNFGAKASSSGTPGGRKSTTTSKPFKPTVTSTKDMNLNFSALKTPVHQTSLKSAQSGRKSGANQASARKSLGASAARKSLSNTPFQFTGNLNVSAVNKSTTKPVFDLKASLARPITWKPHTGKLKPMECYSVKKGLENSAVKPPTSRMDIFKSAVNRTQKTYSRHDRRVAQAAKRAEQKSGLQMKRRGIIVSP